MIDQSKHDSSYQINVDRRNQQTKETETRSKETDSKRRRRRDDCDHVNDRRRPRREIELTWGKTKSESVVEEEEEEDDGERERDLRNAKKVERGKKTTLLINNGLLYAQQREEAFTWKVSIILGSVWKRILSYPWPGYYYPDIFNRFADVSFKKWLPSSFLYVISTLSMEVRIWAFNSRISKSSITYFPRVMWERLVDQIHELFHNGTSRTKSCERCELP